MLRNNLFLTTALVLCASLSIAGQLPKNSKAMAKMLNHAAIVHPNARGSQPVHNTTPNLANAIFSNYSKDANAQYITWYGYRAEYSTACVASCSSSQAYITADNALAFTPAASVTTKKVTVAMFSFYPNGEYQVDIYSSIGGLPGSVIATSKKFTDSDTELCCTSSRTVSIKANLVAGKQYFIGVVGALDGGDGGWMMEDTDFSGAAVDYFHFKVRVTYNHTFSSTYYSSPWHASTYYPTTGAVVLK